MKKNSALRFLHEKTGLEIIVRGSVQNAIVRFTPRARGTKAIINVGWFAQEMALEVELFGTADHTYARHSAPNKIIRAIQLILRKTQNTICRISQNSHISLTA